VAVGVAVGATVGVGVESEFDSNPYHRRSSSSILRLSISVQVPQPDSFEPAT
jgi:hypothetical protein